MKYCTNCGKPMDDFVRICPDCNVEVPNIEQTTRSPYQESGYGEYSHPIRQIGRPTGVTILTVLIGIGILLNTVDGLSNLTLAPILGFYSIAIVIFQIFAIYGLWNMKTWGANAAMLLYGVNILGAIVMAFVFPDLIIEMTMQNITVPSGLTINESLLEATVRGSLMMSLVMAIIIGAIVIYYVNSKKDLFVN